MQYFLAKTDPETYSVEDFAKEKSTTWNGVRNALAVMALKAMKKGDKVLIYHSQGEAAIVGIAKVIGNSKPDPEDSKSWLVDFSFLKKLKEPITLSEIKKSGKFNDFALVRQSRLSTMPVPEHFITWLAEKGIKI